MREVILDVLLAVSGVLVAAGALAWSQPVGLVVAGLVLAGWAWLVLGEIK